jgi:hypothetical protein
MTMTAVRRPGRTAPAGWWLAGGQIAYALWFTGCAIWAVAQYHAQASLNGALAWLVVLGTGQMGPLFAGLSLIVSAWLLVFGYVRANRTQLAAVVIGAAAALGTVIVSISPYGQTVLGFLLD